ncbi:MAG: NFACT family protein, partial [Caldilineaceae bacterium]|nr:NFACT family protein [Caldilineaceae bacterium]
MHFDALTVACVAAELQQTIEGARVQQILAVDEQSLGMELYAQRQRYYLLLTADPKASRVHLVHSKLRRGVTKDSPLLLLLRKYVRGGQLTTIDQPDPTERLLFFHFSHPEHGKTRLVAECITQRANLILINQEDRILDCLRRSWESTGVQRPLMPKQPYQLPPQPEKFAPYPHLAIQVPTVSPTQFELLLQAGGPLRRLLVSNFAGISPTLAAEVAWRATGSIDGGAEEADATVVAQILYGLWNATATGQWQPGIWLAEDAVAGFAPYEVHGRGEFVATASISVALERYYDAARTVAAQPDQETTATGLDSPHDSYHALRQTVRGLLDQADRRLQRQLAALDADEPAPGEAEQLRLQAEWLLALHNQIEPEQPILEVDLGERTLRIPLIEGKKPVEQAEQMFDRAAKLERAAQIIPERRTKLERDLDYVEQLRLDLEQAENQPEIAAIQQELGTMGLLSTTGQSTISKVIRPGSSVGSGQPLRYYSTEGFQIVVGRNARQNEKVTFDIAKGEDLWLHARGAPGAHVVIRSGGQQVSAETIRMAAQLAAYHSKLTGELAATVIVTP